MQTTTEVTSAEETTSAEEMTSAKETMTEQTTTEAITMAQTTTEETTTTQTTTEPPTTAQTTTEAPTTAQTITDAPTTAQITTEAPTTAQRTTEAQASTSTAEATTSTEMTTSTAMVSTTFQQDRTTSTVYSTVKEQYTTTNLTEPHTTTLGHSATESETVTTQSSTTEIQFTTEKTSIRTEAAISSTIMATSLETFPTTTQTTKISTPTTAFITSMATQRSTENMTSQLVTNGTTAPTTTGSATTTLGSTIKASTIGGTTVSVIPTLLPTVPPDCVRYPISSNYYFPDLNSNMSSTGTSGTEVVAGPFGFGSAVKLTSSSQSCLQSRDFYLDHDMACFHNPSNCSSGLSMSIWENVAFNEADQKSQYIVSSGGDTEGMPGVALYHQGVDLHAVVSNGTHYWYLYLSGPIANNTWSNIGMKWKETEGLEIYVDKERIGKIVYPTKVKAAKEGITPPEIAVGCHITETEERYSGFANGKYDELAIWMHDLNETELDNFLGGYDASGANMSVEEVAEIIQTKMNLTDPEQHKQAVFILAIMTQDTGDEKTIVSPTQVKSPTILNTNDTMPLSGPTGTSIGNATTDDSEYDYLDSPEGTKDTATEAEDDLSLIEEVNKLKCFSDTVKAMTDPSKIKQNMTVEEMAKFQNLLTVTSNLLSLGKKQEWEKLQEQSNASAMMVESMQTWAMALAKQATPEKKSKSFYHMTVTENCVLTTNKLTVKEFEDKKGLTTPNYADNKWTSVPWCEGTPRVPKDSALLGRELFDDLGRDPNSNVFIINYILPTYDDIAPLTVNPMTLPSKNIFLDSKVISVLMEPTRGLAYSLYTHPVIITLAHNHKQKTLRKLLFHDESQTIPSIKARYCARWNPSVFPNGGWDSKGCKLFHTGEDYSVCYCEQLGTFAILAQNIQRRNIYPDPLWLLVLKYIFYGLSALFLVIYMGAIICSRHLKDQFHIIRLNMSVAASAGLACMFATDYVRGDRHECTAVTAVLHYAYVAVACWLLMESHAIFSAMMHGTIGGKLKAYLLLAWGTPMFFLGLAFLTGFQEYGLEPRCVVSWDDQLKWSMFGPNLVFGSIATIMVVATLINTSFAAVKKEIIFEDLSSVAWGLLFITFTFNMDWIFACLAYLDIELMYPDFYPIFQVLNASLGFMIFLFMGVGSKRFRIVLRGGTPDGRHLPALNKKPEDLIEVKPQPKHPIGPYQG